MQALDVFLSRLLPQVPGCPDILAKQSLLDSAIEFCEETSVIQSTSSPQTVTAGTATYSLTLPTQQAVSTTLKVWYNTTLLYPATPEQITDILAYVSAAGSSTAARGTPSAYYEFTPGVLGIYPTPITTSALAFSARIATKPLRSATTLEDVLYNDWVEGLVGGAIGRICSTPGQPFSDAGRSAAGYSKFWMDVAKATNVALRGRVRSSIAVRGPVFA